MVGQGMFMLRCGARLAAKPTLPHNIRLTGASRFVNLFSNHHRPIAIHASFLPSFGYSVVLIFEESQIRPLQWASANHRATPCGGSVVVRARICTSSTHRWGAYCSFRYHYPVNVNRKSFRSLQMTFYYTEHWYGKFKF